MLIDTARFVVPGQWHPRGRAQNARMLYLLIGRRIGLLDRSRLSIATQATVQGDERGAGFLATLVYQFVL